MSLGVVYPGMPRPKVSGGSCLQVAVQGPRETGQHQEVEASHIPRANWQHTESLAWGTRQS